MDQNYSYVSCGKSLIGKFLIIASCIVLIACANPYVGRTVRYNHPLVCASHLLPTTCSVEDKNFLSEYRIRSAGEDGKYIVEGKLKYVGSATWTEFQGVFFTLLLCNEGTIFEAVSFAGGQGSLERGIQFKKVFVPEDPFDAVLLDYRMNVKG
ncbi:MAG: hypothetical protein PVI71_15615 [Desulfobacterales bacterium]